MFVEIVILNSVNIRLPTLNVNSNPTIEMLELVYHVSRLEVHDKFFHVIFISIKYQKYDI